MMMPWLGNTFHSTDIFVRGTTLSIDVFYGFSLGKLDGDLEHHGAHFSSL